MYPNVLVWTSCWLRHCELCAVRWLRSVGAAQCGGTQHRVCLGACPALCISAVLDLHKIWDNRISCVWHFFPSLHRSEQTEALVDGPSVCALVATVSPQLQVIQSKQRPRKLTIIGSNGCEFQFLLKGHEDLRQDERVMQLFGLVNNLLAECRETAERDLSIARYAVIPLSPNSGLIGWVRNCDTMHALIREYRESRHIALNAEHRIMQSAAPNYDQMMVIQKVEVFEDALERTSGDDLHKVQCSVPLQFPQMLERLGACLPCASSIKCSIAVPGDQNRGGWMGAACCRGWQAESRQNGLNHSMTVALMVTCVHCNEH